MGDFLGIDDPAIDLFRMGGVEWIGAFFVVGMTILAARWLIGWQMRRFERTMGGKEEPRPAAGKDPARRHESPPAT